MAAIKLRSDYTNEFGRTFKAGQTGRILFIDSDPVVAFDGYADERHAHDGTTNPEWISRVPVMFLERVNGLTDH